MFKNFDVRTLIFRRKCISLVCMFLTIGREPIVLLSRRFETTLKSPNFLGFLHNVEYDSFVLMRMHFTRASCRQ